MKAVAADDVVAVDALDLVALSIGQVRTWTRQVVRHHILGVMDHDAAQLVPTLVKLSGQLGLPVNDDRITSGQPFEVDPLLDAIMSNEEAIVNLAFAVHPVGRPGLTHERSKAVLEYTGADPTEHIFAAVLLEDNGIDPLPMQ
jgi:hypothetical protein